MDRSSIPVTLAAMVLVWVPTGVPAEGQEVRPGAEDNLILRVHRVADLVAPRPDYPYRGSSLPTTEAEVPFPPAVFGGMGGGGMGMGGMGMFQVNDPPSSVTGGRQTLFQFGVQPGGAAGGADGSAIMMGGGIGGGLQPANARFSIVDLCEAITSTVAPESWEEQGGPGVCTPLGGMLLIRQTAAAHHEIQTLLEAIRTEGGTLQALSVEAYWLLLDAAELARLVPDADDGHAAAQTTVDPKALEELSRRAPGYRGRITCFSDQTVHLASGRRRTVSTGATPVVGYGALGYQASIAYPNIGALLQVNPSVLPDLEAAIVNLESTVTAWDQPDEPIRLSTTFKAPPSEEADGAAPLLPPGGTASAVIDRVNLKAQQLATTIRVPLGRPVLVGGLSVPSDDPLAAGEGEKAPKELYLVVKVSVVRNDAPRRTAK